MIFLAIYLSAICDKRLHFFPLTNELINKSEDKSLRQTYTPPVIVINNGF